MHLEHSTLPKSFLERASREARRYGDDIWILLRELVQNSRDAGAANIRFSTANDSTLICHDDGSGMSREDIEGALLRLYSSRKSGGEESEFIGRFGVGFWSVLRFSPLEIRVDTAKQGPSALVACALLINIKERTILEVASTRKTQGTTVTLSGAPKKNFENDISGGIARWTQYVRGINDEPAPNIFLNGAKMNGPLAMPERFAQRVNTANVEGYVGFGTKPRVRLYARGLLVRETTTLESLYPKRRSKFVPAPGLFIDCSINANRVDLLMNRSSIQENKALRLALEDTEKALRKAQNRLLDSLGTLPLIEKVKRHKGVLIMASIAMLLAMILGAGVMLLNNQKAESVSAPSTRVLRNDMLQDLTPSIDSTQGPRDAWPFVLDTDQRMLLRFNSRARFDSQLGFIEAPQKKTQTNYPFATEANVNVAFNADGRTQSADFPLPVSTSGRYQKYAMVDDERVVVAVDQEGQGTIRLPKRQVLVRYGFKHDAPERTRPIKPSALELPGALEGVLTLANKQAKKNRPQFLYDYFLQRYRYSTSERDALAFQNARGTFLEKLEQSGAGDCDIINGALAATLNKVGIPARIAIGFVAENKRVQSQFHAWVEYRAPETGIWKTLDLSTPIASAPSVKTKTIAPQRAELKDWQIASVLAGFALLFLAAYFFFAKKRKTPRPKTVHAIAIVRSLLEQASIADSLGIKKRRFFRTLDGKLRSLHQLEKHSAQRSLVLCSAQSPLSFSFSKRGRLLDSDDALTKALLTALPDSVLLSRFEEAKAMRDAKGPAGVVARAIESLDDEVHLWFCDDAREVEEYHFDAKATLGAKHILVDSNSALVKLDAMAFGQALLRRTTIFRNHRELVLAAIALEESRV